MKAFILSLLLLFPSALVFAMGSGKPKPPTDSEVLDPGEPAYCDPKAFLEKEVWKIGA